MTTTIIFDAEGVIFDSEPVWDRAQLEFLRRRGVVYRREQLKPLLTGRSLIEGVRVMQEMYRFSGEPEILAQERLAIAKEYFAGGVHLINGFLDFHQQVQKQYKICVATAMDRSLFQIIGSTLNFGNFFLDKIFFIEDVGGKGKPSPDIFLHAARKLQTKVEECVVIEDAPLGITAAKRAGMKCIALTTTYKSESLQEADMIVDSFAQIGAYDFQHLFS